MKKKVLGMLSVAALAAAVWYVKSPTRSAGREDDAAGAEAAHAQRKRASHDGRAAPGAPAQRTPTVQNAESADPAAPSDQASGDFDRKLAALDALEATRVGVAAAKEKANETVTADSETTKTTGLQLTAREAKVVTMYESMALAFARNERDCAAMGREVEKIVDDNAQSVADMLHEQAKAGTVQAEYARKRIDDAAGPQIAKLREAIRSGMAHCPNDARVSAALRKLADMQAAASDQP